MLCRRRSVRRYKWRVVLPSQNLTGDPSQEFFADGMTEEMILAWRNGPKVSCHCPHVGGEVQTAARHRPIGHELGVDYVLEVACVSPARVCGYRAAYRVSDQMTSGRRASTGASKRGRTAIGCGPGDRATYRCRAGPAPRSASARHELRWRPIQPISKTPPAARHKTEATIRGGPAVLFSGPSNSTRVSR